MRCPLPLTLLVILSLLVAAAGALGQERRTHVIEPGDTPTRVARKYGVSVEELLRFNSLAPGKGFVVGTRIEIPREGDVPTGTYVVKAGDSVARVADRFGVSQADLRGANNLGKDAALRPGQELTIPDALRGGASRSHTVQPGDTLARIAARYEVTVPRLSAENKLGADTVLSPGRVLVIPEKQDDPGTFVPKKTDKLVTTGEKVAGGVLHTVQPGQTLWTIARAYNVSGDRIARANGIEKTAPLSVGKKVLIPGAKAVVPVRVKGFTVQPVRFVRVWNNEELVVRLMTPAGKVSPAARKQLSKLAQARKGRHRVKLLHPTLIHMLQRVAERWPGHTIEIVSGYRPGERGRESKHSQGRAVDFRVKGIQNREVYEFCTELPRSGCGYYPNSVFVHMDTRDKSCTWTDVSAPGEAAHYLK
jgi:LysM repeat protein